MTQDDFKIGTIFTYMNQKLYIYEIKKDNKKEQIILETLILSPSSKYGSLGGSNKPLHYFDTMELNKYWESEMKVIK